ncbi:MULTISPECIES: transcriptional regulator NrdR [Deinococcus]|uniref:Transcriptional repressor NrdR n=1 Tax=Deinococcus geothermalis (strain DSM 11300 / CIP 105573 / AG-3a) TaxID=319795 RepID=NRDR_DEIGD|nr:MULTISPECIES: transcriptional regulator NrdR [Deinococcus]Q1IWQ7.1 RecName: Full=Transcriptional repressor NrdR [Deinococcus geothermalis DSM 11300]ABF46327.1 Ribonucleotide reductase regulator NrdR-like protein [Deinococcus geothermalis DSM 11300]MBI0444787.1 transcriptional repressor NrdR [Deinococcus sp. DB0503]TDE86205.1 transcriptional repressor NrdR [Deinococcus sp. S9]
MKCPYCSAPDSRVVNSRPSDDGASIRRRRECLRCNRRFTTYERAQLEPLMVLKRGGQREAFNPDKLLRGLILATEKRPVDPEQLRAFAYGFEDEVQASEITSEEIGRRAMTFLRPLDDVAYIRFASVYRDFDSLERFIEEIQGLKGRGED